MPYHCVYFVMFELGGDSSTPSCDAATFSAQFSKLPDGTNYLSSATVNGVKKQLTIQIQNANYQPL